MTVVDNLVGCHAISIVNDGHCVFLLKENYHLPITRNRLSEKQKYLIIEKTIPINEISRVVRATQQSVTADRDDKLS